jgi:CMP/dCMP kinase
MRKIIVAIDGYSACGKSSTAKMVAQTLGYIYIDSGAMYRAVTLYFLEHHIPLTNPKLVTEALKNIKIEFRRYDSGLQTYLNGLNVENEIRKMYVSNQVSEVSTLASVRNEMVAQQRLMGKSKGVVMDGRDIGTVVFPDAELKIFMVAEMTTRAYRRQQELLLRKQMLDLDVIISNLEKRDHIDSTREESPLQQAEDAIMLDTTNLTLEEQIDIIVQMAVERIFPGKKS